MTCCRLVATLQLASALSDMSFYALFIHHSCIPDLILYMRRRRVGGLAVIRLWSRRWRRRRCQWHVVQSICMKQNHCMKKHLVCVLRSSACSAKQNAFNGGPVCCITYVVCYVSRMQAIISEAKSSSSHCWPLTEHRNPENRRRAYPARSAPHGAVAARSLNQTFTVVIVANTAARCTIVKASVGCRSFGVIYYALYK